MAKATREAYGEELAKLVVENEKIVVLDADLAGATKTADAKKACPERFFDFGIAESDMIGHAAGFAASDIFHLHLPSQCLRQEELGNKFATLLRIHI